MKKILVTAIVVALGATSTSVLAETRINGFASITAGAMTDKEDPALFGYTDEVLFKPESLFALQLTSDVGEGLSATAQIMARGSNDYKAEFEWAYVSYEINDSTQINAGKLRIPFYRYSDYLDVGYAYTWARTPQTVYNVPFSTYEGVSVVNSHTIGDVDSTLQFIYGSYEGETIFSTESKLSSLAGVNWTVTYDWLTARAVYMAGDTSLAIASASASIDYIAPDNQEAADSLTIEDDSSSFFGLGLSADYNNILVDTEFTRVEVEDSLIAVQEQYYVSVGYRLGDYTVYAMSEHREDVNDDNYSSVLSNVSPAPTIPSLQAAYMGVLLSQEQEIDALSIGIRYNFHPAAALKFNYTTYDTLAFNTDTFSFANTESSVFSVGLNLVF